MGSRVRVRVCSPPGALFIWNRAWRAECGSVVSDSCDPRLLCPWVRVSGLPFPSPGDLPDPGIEPGSLRSLGL